jgi:beta-1,4-mannosyltransferase
MSQWEDQNDQLKILKQTLFVANAVVNHDHTTFVSSTLQTVMSIRDEVTYRPHRPLFLISSTSWTVDEDFSILLTAMILLEKKMMESDRVFPAIMCVITGKGPMKEYYEREMKKSSWNYCHFITTWLSSSDYPQALGCADLGISLHTSSSGLDLPMKVLDMYGAGLPVCAVKYACLEELVDHGVTGWTFSTPLELSDLLMKVLLDFPENRQLKAMKQSIQLRYQSQRWKDSWRHVMTSILSGGDNGKSNGDLSN